MTMKRFGCAQRAVIGFSGPAISPKEFWKPIPSATKAAVAQILLGQSQLRDFEPVWHKSPSWPH
jgi:hypothetical protein